MNASPRTPPKKKPGQGLGHRTINGLVIDVRGAAALVGESDKGIRGKVTRRTIPFKRLGGRIIFLRSELEAWLHSLEGCSLDEAKANREARHE